MRQVFLTNATNPISAKFGLVATISACLFLALLGAKASAESPESLLIGPGDVLHVQIADTPELDQHARVTDAGEVPIQGAGNVKIAGTTPAAAANIIRDRLIAAHYMNHPQVMVSVEQFATQTVSVLGEVKAAGAYQITTPRPILDILALAGGVTPIADRHILVERHSDPAHLVEYYYSNDAHQAMADQVTVNPGDTVMVAKAGIVYVLGDVNHPGGFAMTNNESRLTVLQAVASAGGISKTAKLGRARLIRHEKDNTYSDRQLSLSDLQQGKVNDIAMEPGDVLYVPFSYGKNLAVFGAGSIAASATSATVYALP
jgi:polysaccharide export outer membrane protein